MPLPCPQDLKESWYQPDTAWHPPCSVCILFNSIMTSKHSYVFLWHSYRTYSVVNSICVVHTRATTWCTTGALLLRAISGVESSNMAHRKLFHHSSLSHFQGILCTSLLIVSVIKISPTAGAPPALFHVSHSAHTSYENHKYMCVQVEK